jgi:peroxidase
MRTAQAATDRTSSSTTLNLVFAGAVWLITGSLLFCCSCVVAAESKAAAAAAAATVRPVLALETGFYQTSCPELQNIVSSVVASHVRKDPTSGAPLVRLFFHDCAVNGCDASVLIDSTPNNTAEKDAVPNLTLAGFNIISDIKSEVEARCAGIVSCADIIALAAKDAVAQQGGPNWNVELGRRDGVVSSAAEATDLLPSSHSNAQSLIATFGTLNLTSQDLVALSGAHTFGKAHCTEVARRFYGFNSTTGMDPTLSAKYGEMLRSLCPLPLSPTATVSLDPVTPNAFDKVYYSDLLQGKGLMSSDAGLVADPDTARIVLEYSQSKAAFFEQFATSMIKLGRVGMTLGSEGQVRRNCSAVN